VQALLLLLLLLRECWGEKGEAVSQLLLVVQQRS
jgi:hypothetical protein